MSAQKNRERQFVVVLLGAFALAVFLTPREQEDEWTPTYEYDDARPLGSRMLFETLPALFDEQTIKRVDLSPYELLADTAFVGTAYLFITMSYAPDQPEIDALMDYVAAGNQVFIAAADFGEPLYERLGFSVESHYQNAGIRGDTMRINLVNADLGRPGGYLYDVDLMRRYLAFEVEADSVTVLGGYENSEEPNFVRVAHGRGAVYMTCLPRAYTNYSMLEDGGHEYVYQALSYLPKGTALFWDDYFKPFRRTAATPLRYILSAPALRTAFLVALGGLLLFMAFHARRRQRPIPRVEPPVNTTIEFVETIGRLYYHQGDHRNLIGKLIGQWKHYVRTRLFVEFDDLQRLPVELIAHRCGVEVDRVRQLKERLIAAEKTDVIDEGALHEVAGALDEFYSLSVR